MKIFCFRVEVLNKIRGFAAKAKNKERRQWDAKNFSPRCEGPEVNNEAASLEKDGAREKEILEGDTGRNAVPERQHCQERVLDVCG